MIALQVRLPNGVQLDLGERTLKELPSLGADAEPTAMFRFDKGLKVYLHREPVDFPLNINGLAELVGQARGLAPFASYAYMFGNRRRDREKILRWERNGL